METTRQNNDRATIYDYKSGEEIRRATADEEQRYIDELLSMTGHQRMVGAVDGEDYEHDGSIYMQGGRVEIVAGIPDVDYDRAGQLWDRFVGSQGTEEFMAHSQGISIREAVEDYVAQLNDMFGQGTEDDAPEDLEKMLAAYIERDLALAQLRRE